MPLCPHGSLDSKGCSACTIDALTAENGRLWDAVDRLWAWMAPNEVAEIRQDEPELAGLAVHAHHRMSHEQRMMRR